MRFLRFFIALTAFLAIGQAAFAQENVAVRSGAHNGYSRLVFEWPSTPEYSVSKEGARVLIRFGKAGAADTAGVSAGDSNIKSVETVSSGTEPLQVAVTIPEGSRFRDFIVGNKMILDVYAPEGKTAVAHEPKKEEPKIEPVKDAAPEPAKTVEAKPEPTPQPTPTKQDFSVTPAPSETAVPVTSVETHDIAPHKFDPHVITLTGTTNIGLSVFERNGWLWLVMDARDLPVTPEIAGPQKGQLPPLIKLNVEQGTVWRMDLPEGLRAYGEGGGLSWRVVLGPKEMPGKAAQPMKDAGGGAAKLIWPLENMRKAVTFADPDVGDLITAVTASDASQFAGAAREFVNLQTLKSVVGLAYVAKSDGVKPEITMQQVSVGQPGGLALSAIKDAQPEQIRQAMNEPKPEEKEVEAPPVEERLAEEKTTEEKAAEELAHEPGLSTDDMAKAGQEKPSGNNIYNFPRWEMGGIGSLDKNQHVMMMDLSNKKDDARNEDIVTLAKMNLANDRGPEALGLMRIALQKVPELEDNAEFNALRGAAFALSGKYDEAIIDYSREALKKYDDVNYWRAFTLAGLEDWKQAIAVMPKGFQQIANYPSAVKIPLTLTFAEIALRAGRIEVADHLLDTLKAQLPKLPLQYASSWNYLAGEAARQRGDNAKAMEYWEPLVKAGKDDLFRAKAGLSLTKLQLDTKKITPAQAIDRLEGLRYAWRGDELETLINFRLGQVYIDNKDYLKGLTVLRNASTLSPGSDLSRDVSAYMVKTFRDVFSNDRLKKVSPLEAISLHQEFKDLLPPGEEGDRFVEKLAERLVDAELLGRAAALLEYQVNNRLKGDKKAEIAIRLAAIRLLDGNPDGALRSLEIAQDTLNRMSAGTADAPAGAKAEDPLKKETAAPATAPASTPAAIGAPDPEKQRQISLLKARALSMKKKTDEAIAILDDMRVDADVARLRADIAWTAAKWDEASIALNDLIVSEDISPKRPLTDYQRDIIFNRAIALNLSGNRVALANLRERYNAQMKGTSKGSMFEIVTRPRRPDMIGSREAIESMISEIDLFKGFVDGYAKMDAPPEAARTPEAPKEPVPADATQAPAASPEAAAQTPAPAQAGQ